MITAILLFLPLIASLLLLTLKGEQVKKVALGFTLIELALAIITAVKFIPDASTQFLVNVPWVSSLGIHFKIGIDGISLMMVLLTTLLFPLIILSTFKHDYKNPSVFYALMLLMQTGLLGVFVSLDAFLFYVAWEVALIPVYFLAAIWGGENRIKVTLKFFIYTILGSFFMLVGIIYLYLQTPGDQHSFDINAFYSLNLDQQTQAWVFWMFFIAFAIKIPIFPFHTWQPDTYTESPAPATMLLSGIMLKMGIYGIIRWILPVVPMGAHDWSCEIIILSIIGIVYASVIAFTQKDVKRLIAYSSIAHVGLITAGVFTMNTQAMQGAMIQMLNHGINVVGLFFIISIIEQRTRTREIAALGGIVNYAPVFAICFTVIMMGSVALPLTNGFIGEFLLLVGIFNYNLWASVFAGLTIILGAVYMLRMYQKVMLGESNQITSAFTDIKGSEKIVLYTIVVLVIAIGVYPKPLMHLSEAAVANLLQQVESKIVLIK
jgi:NADH-quinone oxidoreductase subunit M